MTECLLDWQNCCISCVICGAKVFDLIDKRIKTLEANSKQCHMGGSHEKGIEFTLQAELLERLKKELSE